MVEEDAIPAEASHWQNTKLWRLLAEGSLPEAPAVRHALNSYMPKIQKVLAQGGTAPTDFTLHDSGHAFRVAECMAQVIPEDVLPRLSIYELSLLMMSAYL